MPKATFFNLTEEKRGRILNTALDEFAEHGYQDSSVSRIVARAEIAKGSFYQYFNDKDDLFIFVIGEMIARRKLSVYEKERARLSELSLTEFLRLVFHRQIDEFAEDPRIMKISLELIRLTAKPVFHQLMDYYQVELNSLFTPFIQEEIARGEIDPGVNVQILNFMLVSLGQYLTSLLLSGNVDNITHSLIDRIVDDLEYIFSRGIYNKAAN
ncbi:MAG: TetR/AcrR family transcriptional regulator [Oscillospiraceae bacterium]|jgi:AcrR family transcriptional regulator|nr:TetR/AcrR family transcriptional regulator [Oscillospiraceae bacterium]